ncbi:hypothetical protein ACFXPN_39005 [Streptomyces griseorubiginosus]|uniref:hypothetical protein n=1 Tax=Streptomyces griseorubiginosus TaxID=67304 RepID=UPI0036CE2808
MTGRKSPWMAAAGLAGAAVAVRKARTPWPATDSADRWLSVTVNCAPHDEAPRAYDMFKQKTDGCVRAVIRPGG